jgi:hypothetical protein
MADSILLKYDDNPFEIETEARSLTCIALDVAHLVMYLVAIGESGLVYLFWQLCHEDYNWWWNSFLIGVIPSFYLLLDSTVRILI